jgi:5-methylcytosine-specific restriction endonuclease McrA
VEAPAPPRPKVAPLSPQRFALQLTMGQSLHDKLRHAQALLSHQIPSGDVTQVLERALDLLIGRLEKRKFAATARPQDRRRGATSRRCIPAQVRRAVWERDQGQCTFVGETGHRCAERRFLEFDHIDPVARGGEATVERMRLRCRAHNQYEAECTFGADFMDAKRTEARRAVASARAAATEPRTEARHMAAEAHARAAAAERRRAAAKEQARDVMAGLRELGFHAAEARRAAEYSETLQDATLEDRMRLALVYLCPKPRVEIRVGTCVGAPS